MSRVQGLLPFFDRIVILHLERPTYLQFFRRLADQLIITSRSSESLARDRCAYRASRGLAHQIFGEHVREVRQVSVRRLIDRAGSELT